LRSFKGRIMRIPFGILLVGCLPILSAQAPISRRPASEAQLSPQDAYEQAVRPLEITRRATQNWSDVELKALKVARENAKSECVARSPERFAGADLLGLARLCAFAQQWESVHWAASDYIVAAQSSGGQGGPKSSADLATAFDHKIQSSLNLKNVEEAVADCQTMMRSVPYDVFTSEATNSTIDAVRFTHTDQALALLNQRQPIILSLIRGHEPSGPNASDANIPAPNGGPSLPLHTLYADALALGSLEQFVGQEKAAAESFMQLESALPATVSPNDALYIEQQRRQYQLLGEHLPTLNPMGCLLFSGAASPEGINTNFANGAVFLLFPDWCNQCIAMGPDATQKNRELVANHKVRLFLLMAQANPPEKSAPVPIKSVPLSSKAAKAAVAQGQQIHFDQQLTITSDPDRLLVGTPTVVVPNETLQNFAATDFPLIIATDHNGIVRWMSRAQGGALDSGGEIDEIVKRILAAWPAE
jgi:hypothetical protein